MIRGWCTRASSELGDLLAKTNNVPQAFVITGGVRICQIFNRRGRFRLDGIFRNDTSSGPLSQESVASVPELEARFGLCDTIRVRPPASGRGCGQWGALRGSANLRVAWNRRPQPGGSREVCESAKQRTAKSGKGPKTPVVGASLAG